jgi:AcrR family transcriptional regulator
MGRPREFDEAQVVAAARDAFWTGGVAATSITDLSQATGLSTGSLYKAFGSKAALTERTLEDYLQQSYDHLRTVLDEAASGLAGLRAWLDGAVAAASDDGPTRGCFAVVCAVELAERDEQVRQRLRRHDDQMRALLASAVRRAVGEGDLDVDPAAGAQLLHTTVVGLQVDARKGVSAATARATLDLALRALT